MRALSLILVAVPAVVAQVQSSIQECYESTFSSSFPSGASDTMTACEAADTFPQSAMQNIIQQCFGGQSNNSLVATAENYVYRRCLDAGVVIPWFNVANPSSTHSVGSMPIYTTLAWISSSIAPTPTLELSTPLSGSGTSSTGSDSSSTSPLSTTTSTGTTTVSTTSPGTTTLSSTLTATITTSSSASTSTSPGSSTSPSSTAGQSSGAMRTSVQTSFLIDLAIAFSLFGACAI